jgi:hypothetical protein
MGTARSGSTILEILLANGRHVFGAGELTNLIEDGFIEDKLCSCRHPASECEIWSKVKKGMRLNNKEFHEWAYLQKHVDWHDGFLRQMSGRVSGDDSQLYKTLNQRLLNVIKQVTDCEYVVDSSKYAGRALALHRIVNADISVICLTRSPAGLMASFQKPNKDEQRPKSPMGAFIYYLITLAILRVACWRLGKHVLQLRYEDFLSDPAGTLESIETWQGLDLSEIKKNIEENAPFEVGHIVTGNRLRKKGKVFFQAGKVKEQLKNTKNRILVSIMHVWQWGLRF